MQRHVDDALSKGAQLVHGGKRLPGPGSFFAPTVLSDVPADALVNTEETFGPLAALTRFETEEEVVKLANATPVGLAGYFFSRDVGRVWRVAEALEVGMVGTNTGLISQAVIPFGGVKESGLGTSALPPPVGFRIRVADPSAARSRGRSWNRGVHERQVHRLWWPLSVPRGRASVRKKPYRWLRNTVRSCMYGLLTRLCVLPDVSLPLCTFSSRSPLSRTLHVPSPA